MTAVIVLLALLPAALATPPHLISIIVDDLGWHDTAIRNNQSFMTQHFADLAQSGITLQHHHSYMYCSPTRRSFLSGRFPVHITGQQAGICTSYLPLNFTLLPAKLKEANFETHMVGKGHLGYMTTDHLPVNRGFDSHVGYLNAAEDYHFGNAGYYQTKQCSDANCSKDMWHNHGPGADIVDQIYYSAEFYTNWAIGLLRNRSKTKPFYLHLTYQSVHAPFEDPPAWLQVRKGSYYDNTWASMLNAVDSGLGNITTELKAQGMWSSTFLVLLSDNGGECWNDGAVTSTTPPANNFPVL
eukprot:g143.t1